MSRVCTPAARSGKLFQRRDFWCRLRDTSPQPAVVCLTVQGQAVSPIRSLKSQLFSPRPLSYPHPLHQYQQREEGQGGHAAPAPGLAGEAV